MRTRTMLIRILIIILMLMLILILILILILYFYLYENSYHALNTRLCSASNVYVYILEVPSEVVKFGLLLVM